MNAVAPTAASPLPPRPVHTADGLPPALPSGSVSGGGESVRLKVAHWMEAHLGKAALPAAALAGGAIGGGLGFLTLGPVGALAGGAAGAFFGGVLFMAG